MFFELCLKYAHNGVLERDRDVMRVWGCSIHTVVKQKRKISDSRAFAAYVERWHTPYSFELCTMKKKERKKESRTKPIFYGRSSRL